MNRYQKSFEERHPIISFLLNVIMGFVAAVTFAFVIYIYLVATPY